MDRAANVRLLEQVTDAVAGKVSVRDLTSPTSALGNGWAMGPYTGPTVQTPEAPGDTLFRPVFNPDEPYLWQISAPMTFASPGERAVLLPQPAGYPGQPAPPAGAWSDFNAGTPILPAHVSEASAVLSAIDANGLWVAKGRAAVSGSDFQPGDYSRNHTYDPGAGDPAPWPAAPSFDAWEPLEGHGLVGVLDSTPIDGPPTYYYEYIAVTAAFYSYSYYGDGNRNGTGSYADAGASAQVTLPDATNPDDPGGPGVTALALGPDGTMDDPSGWAWGGQVTLTSITAAQADQVVSEVLPQPGPTAGDYSVQQEQPSSLGPRWWYWTSATQSTDDTGVVNGTARGRRLLGRRRPVRLRPGPFHRRLLLQPHAPRGRSAGGGPGRALHPAGPGHGDGLPQRRSRHRRRRHRERRPGHDRRRQRHRLRRLPG